MNCAADEKAGSLISLVIRHLKIHCQRAERVILLDLTALQPEHIIGQSDYFVPAVTHIDHRDFELSLHAQENTHQLLSGCRVERGQGFVKEQ